MEQKTAEEIYQSSEIFISKGKKKGTYSLLDVVTHAMQVYTDQEVSKAIDNALIKCSAKAITHSSQLAEQIISLKPEILKELEK